MKKKRFSVEQIVGVLKQAEVGVPVGELIRKVGISEQTFYRWKKQYVGLEIDQVRQLKQLQEDTKLQLLAERFENDESLTAEEQSYLDEKSERYEQLIAKLGYELDEKWDDEES